MTTDAGSGEAPLQRQKPRRRIAQKLFLFYVLPLSVLIVAGIALPFFLWSYFGRFVEQYQASLAFSESVASVSRAAEDAATLSSAYILTGDPSLRQEFVDANKQYLSGYSGTDTYVEGIGNGPMRDAVMAVRASYRDWYGTAIQLVRARRAGKPPLPAEVRSNVLRVKFVSVRNHLNALAARASAWERQLYAQARTAEVMRRTTSVAIPLIAVFLAFLIGRSIALGITRPLESLTLATEQLERGDDRALDEGSLTESGDSDDEIGELQQAFGRMARTISQREAMLRAQNEALGALNQRIEAVLNATNDGIALLDRSGAFLVVNQRFADLFGIEPDVLLDQTFAQAAPLLLSRFKNRSAVRERLERLVRDAEATEDDTFEVAEPAVRTLRLYTAPVRGDASADGTPPELMGRIFVFRDVTRETMVDRMKTEFVSTVSHELRTPLTAIKGYVDLMVGGQTGTLNEVQTEFLTMVQASTKRLTSLINDILDISRIEEGRMEMRYESVDYVALVRQVARMMHREAEERSIELGVEVVGDDGDSLPLVQGDADRITQVLVNFLSNGIKYTPVGGHVTVRIEFEDSFVTTCVEDDGIGIAPEDQTRLFQKFFRADNSTTRETGGTGLGLAITKAILEKLNGSVWVESEQGKGSRFWFTLPTVAPDEGGDGTATASRLVLSIDSNQSALHRLGHELRHHGFVTTNAATGVEALRRARGLRPDVITLDLLSPGLDGFAMLRELQESDATRAVPVLLLSVRLAAGRAELRDTIEFIPRPAGGVDLAVLIQTAVYGKTDPTVLVVGDDDLSETIRPWLPGGAHLLSAGTPEEADEKSPALFPDAVVIDTAVAPGAIAGQWVARRKALRPGDRLPVIVLVDPDVLTRDVQPLVPFGAGPLPIERIGPVLRQHLIEQKALVAA